MGCCQHRHGHCTPAPARLPARPCGCPTFQPRKPGREGEGRSAPRGNAPPRPPEAPRRPIRRRQGRRPLYPEIFDPGASGGFTPFGEPLDGDGAPAPAPLGVHGLRPGTPGPSGCEARVASMAPRSPGAPGGTRSLRGQAFLPERRPYVQAYVWYPLYLRCHTESKPSTSG